MSSGRGKTLAFNPLSQVKTTPIFDGNGNIVAMVEEQPREKVDTAIELAKYVGENARPLQSNTQRHMRHVAEIPNAVVNDLMRRGIWGDQKAMLKWLDTEGRAFKSFAGNLS